MAPRALARMLVEKLRAAYGDRSSEWRGDSLVVARAGASSHDRGWAGNSSVYTPRIPLSLIVQRSCRQRTSPTRTISFTCACK